MKRKRLISWGMRVLVIVALFGLNEFSFAAEDIEKETYRLTSKGQLIYNGKCALDLGHMSLIPKDKKESKRGDRPIDLQNLVAKEGYQECTYSRTWEDAGFTYETNTKLYPRKVVHTISYKFTKEWEGSIYIYPWMDPTLIMGARYKATDTVGKLSQGVVQAYPKKYTFIPYRRNLKELELYPVEGGMIRYKIENKNPLQEDPAKNPWATNSLFVDILGEDGKLGRAECRLNLQQMPPKEFFPAGYSNEIKLEIEFHKQMAMDIHRPFTIAYYTDQAPVIDGNLDDPVWEKAEREEHFYWSEGPKTWFSIAYDEKNIYLAVECREPAIDKIRKGKFTTPDDGNIWRDDSIEIFFDPKASRENYFHFMTNFSNVRYDSKRGKGKRDVKWNAPNWRSATKENKDRWTLETAIPFSDIACSFPEDEIWGFHITRNRNSLSLLQSTIWPDVKSNHNVERYGSLIFGRVSNLLPDYMKLTEGDITPLKKAVLNTPLDGYEGSAWALKRIQLLASKEKEINENVLSGKVSSDKEARALLQSIQSLPEEYQNLSEFIASFKTDFKPVFVNPINIKEDTTRILAKDFSRAENAVLDKDKQYVTRTKDPKPNMWAPTRLDYNLIVEKEGTYLLRAKLAAATYRPIKLFLDDRHLTSSVLSQITGSWDKPEWFNQGAIYLTSGKHTLRFEIARTRELPPLYEIELIRKEGVTAQETLSMKFNTYFEDDDLRHGHFIVPEVNCLPNDRVRIEVSCINESKKPTKAKIALWSAKEKRDIKTWEVDIPGGEICPAFVAQLRLPEKIDGLYRFSIPEGIEDYGLQKPGFKGIPLLVTPHPKNKGELELELYDEIDCTKDNDPKHPYAEYRRNKARVVTGPAGRYRLSGPYFSRRSKGEGIIPPMADSFGYRLTFKKEDLGKTFEIVCDVPDDAMRVFAIQFIERYTPRYILSPGIATGGNFPLSNKMVHLKFTCWPREEHPVLLFMNHRNGGGAACSRIRIYKVKSGYPSFNIKSKGRIMGTHWEEPRIENIFGNYNPARTEEIKAGKLSFDFNRRKHQDAVGQLAAARNYFEYKSYIGDNAVFLPGCVYGTQQYPSAILHLRPFPGTDLPGEPLYLNDTMGLYFKIGREYGIGIIIELAVQTDWGGERPFIYQLDRKYTPSRSPVFLVHKSGKVRPKGKQYCYNPLHPEIQDYSLSLVRELVDLYGDEPGFKGISLRTTYYNWVPFLFTSLDFGYGDYTIEKFQKDTGIKIPVEYNQGQRRFSKRYTWLMMNAREQWLNWRCMKMNELYQRMAKIIRGKNPDAKLYLHYLEPNIPDGCSPMLQYLDDGYSVRDRLRAKGVDPKMYKDDKTIVCTQAYMWTPGAHGKKGMTLQFERDLNLLPETWNLLEGKNRTMILFPDYWEHGIRGGKYGIKWPQPGIYPDFWNVEIMETVVADMNPAGRNMLARYAISMALDDFLQIYDGGIATGTMGYEEYKREFARAFLALPNVPFEPFSKQSEPVFLWQKKHEGRTYFYLSNAYWCESKVTLEVANAGRDQLVDLSNGKTIPAKKKKGGKHTYELSLKSYQFRSFSLPGAAEIISINTEIPEKEIIRLQRIEKDIESILEKAKKSLGEGPVFKFALDTLKAGKAALAKKRYFEAQRQFENYKLDRIYQQFGYPKGLKFLGQRQDYRLLTSGPATD